MQSAGLRVQAVQDSDKKEFRLENLDVVLMATGRHPNTKNIGLEKVHPCIMCMLSCRTHWSAEQ